MPKPQLTANSPGAGQIAWASFSISFSGCQFSFAAGSTADKFVWWIFPTASVPGTSYTGVLATGAVLPTTLTSDDLVLFVNRAGTPINVQSANVVDGSLVVTESIVGDAIQVNTLDAGRIKAGTITAQQIKAGSVTVRELGVSALSDGLAINGEMDDATAGLPAGWSLWSTTGAPSYGVTTSAISGAQSLRLTVPANASILMASPSFPVVAGRSYALGAAMRSDQAYAEMGMAIVWGTVKDFTALLGATGPVPDPVVITDLDGALTAETANPSAVAGGSYLAQNITPPANAVRLLQGKAQAPTGALWARLLLISGASATGARNDDWDAVDVRRVTISTYIGDGVIATRNVSADIITTGQLLAGQSIVAGNPVGQRAELTQAGFQSYGIDPVTLAAYPAVKLGTGGADILGVADAAGNVKASIDSTGKAVLQELQVNGDPEFMNKKLSETLADYSTGNVAYAWYNADAPLATSEVGWFEVAGELKGGRIYRIKTTPALAIVSPSSDTTASVAMYLRTTHDGSTPSITSTQRTSGVADHNRTMNTEFLYSCPADETIRVLITYKRFTGAGTTSVALNGSNVNPISLTIDDVGPTPGNRRVMNTGGGTAVAAKRQYVRTYRASWWGMYAGTAISAGTPQNAKTGSGSYMRVGRNEFANSYRTLMGNWRRDIGGGVLKTPFEEITTGGTVDKVELYLWVTTWTDSSGSDLWYGSHNLNISSEPASYPAASSTTHDQGVSRNWGTPGVARWVTLPSTMWDGWRTGSIRGIILGGPSMETKTTYGNLLSPSYSDGAYQPQLRVTYTV